MADRKPLKVLPDSASGTGGGDSTGIGEFVAGDTLGVVDGGTGLAAVGANQILTGNDSSTTGALTSESNLTFDGTTLGVIGNAGVGIARTDGTLHVHTATAGSVTPNANEDDLVIENSGNCGITILAPDASDSTLCFGSTSDAVGAVLRWNHDANLLKLSTANAGDSILFGTAADVEAMRIDSAGDVGIGTTAPSGWLANSNARVLAIHNTDTTDGNSATELALSVAHSTSWNAISFTNGAKAATSAEGKILYDHNTNSMRFSANASERMRIQSDGHIQTGYAASAPVTMNDDDNAKNTLGLTLMQDAADDEILSLKSSDVSHGMTNKTGADTYATLGKFSGTAGGLMLRGFGTGIEGIFLNACYTTDTATRSTGATAPLLFQAAKNAGDGNFTTPDTGSNLVAFGYDGGTTRFIFDASGSGHADVEWTTFSDARLKKNVIDCPYGLAEVLQLEPKTFDKHSGKIEDGEVVLEENSRRMIGFLAQDVKALMPELVKDLPDDQSFYSLNDGKLAAVLVNAIQELNAKLEAN